MRPKSVHRVPAVLSLFLLTATPIGAQIASITNQTSTPIQGAGHDYIRTLSETTNPANGSISLRIQAPTPQGRKLSLPFSFSYDSSGAQHVASNGVGGLSWEDNAAYLAKSGWSYSVPMLSYLKVQEKTPGYGGPSTRCTYYVDYLFNDASGARHSLSVSMVPSPQPSCQFAVPIIPNAQLSGSDDYFQAQLTTNTIPPLVSDADGTVYNFNSTPHAAPGSFWSSLPSSIEDRNGNLITVTDGGTGGAFTATDTLGRTVLSSSGFGSSGNTMTVSGLSSSYALTWGTATASFTIGSSLLQNSTNGCSSFPSDHNSLSVVTAIALPNSTSYSFLYDPAYGLLSKISYPSGGYVSYTYGLNPLSEFASFEDLAGNPNSCLYHYDGVALTHRYVSFDGSHIALQQDFTYSTNWNGGVSNWATKTTTVKTTDLVTGAISTIVYTYSPFTPPSQPNDESVFAPQLPLEQSVVYKDSTGTTLRTVNKTWTDQYELGSEQTTLDNGFVSKSTFTYGPGAQVTSENDYDYGSGAPGPLLKKTVNSYQGLNATPIYPTAVSIFDKPCQTIVYDGTGTNRVAETDYFYDGSTSTTPCSAATTQALTGTGSYTGHDETHYGTSASPSRGNLTKKSMWVNSSGAKLTTTYAYDETGQVTSTIDPRLNQTSYSYADSYSSGTPPAPTNAYVTTVTHPQTGGVNHVEHFAYAYASGLVTSSTDQNNLVTTYKYVDNFARPTETDFPDGGVSTIAYNDNAYNPSAPSPSITAIKKVNPSTNVVTVNATDGLGHVATNLITSDPQGTIHTDTTYDGLGRVSTVSNPYRAGLDPTTSSGTTTYGYDALGRKIRETEPDGSILTTAYCGPNTLVTDPTGKWRRSRTDGAGRLVEVDEPNGPGATVNSNGCPGTGEPIWVTNYTVDALGNLTQVLQNGSRQRNFTYDFLSRLLTANNPETGAITYNYDADTNCSLPNSFAGLLVSKIDARGIRTCTQYDALNRDTVRNYSNGDAPVTTTYDQPSCLGLPACQNVGQRTSVNDAAGSEAWSYQVDITNFRSVHINQRTTSSIAKTSTYYLDLAGNVTQAVYPTGRIVNYTYDAANRPKTAVDGSNGITYATDFQTVPSGCLSGAVCYTPQGTFYALSIGQGGSFTGLNLTHTYNARLQPNEFKASSSAGNAIDVTYNFVDPTTSKNAGHVYSITNNLDGTRSQTFGYDQLNRITAAQTTSTFSTSPAHCWGETFGLDAWSNLQSIAATTNPAYTGCSQESGFSRPADGNNHLNGFSYDAAGNTSNDSSFSYTWDGESQLKSAGGVNYLYDGDGRRATKIGSKLYWYGSGSDILAETGSSGNTTAEYIFFGGKRIAMLPVGGNPIYYVEDLLGTSRVITQSNGAVCYDADFYPYGGERSYINSCPQNYKFEGKERDTETGNDDFGARYYSNRFGRWLSADWSAVPVPVPYANLSNPQTLNLYAMVADDPESFADLDGHDCCDVWDAINFIVGAANAYGSDNLAGAGRQQQDTTAGKLGAAAGDFAATVQGAEEFTVGGTGVATGVSLSATGEGALVGVPLAVVSAPVTAHGAIVATQGAGHLGAAAADAIKNTLNSPVEKSGPKEGSAGGPGAGKRATTGQRNEALKENNGKCVFCGKKATQADHAVPRSRNGNNTKKNLQPTCEQCNKQKGAKTTAEYKEWKKAKEN